MNVLVLGGTAEARRLAEELTARGWRVTTSLAGRVALPRPLPGRVRVGGFGGPAGLAAWLRAEGVDAVVDATHPFAARISASARAACDQTGVPRAALTRPGWVAGPGDRWQRVPSLSAAASALTGYGERVFLTTGRQSLAAFAGVDSHWFLVRCVDPPEGPLPSRAEVLLDRGPFTVDGELLLLRRHRIDVLVTKDSGGGSTAAKLLAARELGVPVLMVDRPVPSSGLSTVEDVLDWLAQLG